MVRFKIVIEFVEKNALIRSRYECKYLVPDDRVQAMREWIAPFVEPDRFARFQPGHRYAIGSLYLDSSDLALYRTTTEGHKNRFKLRIRSYTDDLAYPVFFEIKYRVDQIVRKRRARVERDAALDFLRGQSLPESGIHADDRSSFAEFVGQSRKTVARPIVRVRYKREAYESTGHDPVRVTFDTELCHAVTRDATLLLGGPGWSPTPLDGTILELKFTDLAPSWVFDVVRAFQLDKRSIAKYVLSMENALEERRYLPGIEA